ncbi:MAG: glycosyltransferase, partial [Gammaproteobacteria bacterium]|nr:glycosyltransferase [Gammaproteobacteria bacterium]
MKVVITALGSGGDVFPFIALGQTLQQRGHNVTLIANPHFAAEVDRAGLMLKPLGTEAEYLTFLQQPEVWDAQRGFPMIWRYLIDLTPRILATIETSIMPGETVLVGSTLSLATRLAQERHGLPAVTVHLAPNCFLSAYEFPVTSARPLPSWVPLWVRRALL